MAKLLYIESSPRKDRAASIGIAQAFLESYKKAHPHDEVKKIDLWQKNLPPFDGEVINAKYAILHGEAHSSKQAQAWKAVEELISEFKDADKYLFSLPMWNFGIPYKLKHYIDLLVQPGYTFKVTQEGGYQGLVTGKKAALVYARGGEYGSQEPLDLQVRYMETILRFIGFNSFTSILIQPTLSGNAEAKRKILDTAKDLAEKEGSKF